MSRLQSPVEILARCLHHAALIALPAKPHQRRDWAAEQAYKDEHGKAPEKRLFQTLMLRPDAGECSVAHMFPQTWGSTAMGFGGIGGAAMTDAYTVVIKGPEGHLVVYWGGQEAYLVEPTAMTPKQLTRWKADIAQGRTVNCDEAVDVYGAKPL